MAALQIAFLLLMAAAPAGAVPVPEAENWTQAWIALGKDASGAVWRVRAKDMVNVDNYRPAVWVMKDHRGDRSTRARTTRNLQVIDCMAQTSDVRATIGYSPSGKILWNVKSATPNPQKIVASTMADAVRRNVCPKPAVSAPKPS